jgi:uncharacterized protein YqeY
MQHTLKQRLNEDVKSALRAGDKQRVGALRFILAAIKQREVDERITLDDTQILAVFDKLAKQRKESLAIYQQANRQDLVSQETFELELIQLYLPAPLSAEDIVRLIEEAIAQSNAKGPADMGKVMAVLKPALQGKADMSAVSGMVKERLSA